MSDWFTQHGIQTAPPTPAPSSPAPDLQSRADTLDAAIARWNAMQAGPEKDAAWPDVKKLADAYNLAKSGPKTAGGDWFAANGIQTVAQEDGPTARTWTDTAVDALPMAGGTIGGIVGGIGGTVGGVGVGGVPGAIGGAALGGGAGEAVKQLINRFRGAEAPATAGAAALDIAKEGGIQGGLEAGGALLTKGLATGAKAVYRGYLKPSLARASLGKAEQIVQTALDEALPVTEAGSAHAKQVIGELKTQVDDILASTPGHVDLADVAGRVRAFARQRYFRPGNDMADYEAAMRVANSIDGHPSLGLPAGVRPTRIDAPLPMANTVKRDLQTGVGTSQYGVPSAAGKSAEKMGAREVRLDIERAAPTVGPLNAREGRLIDAAKAIDRAVGREANKSPLIGVNTLLAGALGGEEYRRTGNPYEAAAKALAVRMALTPAVASRAAIVAARLGNMAGVNHGVATIARAAVAAVSGPDAHPPPD